MEERGVRRTPRFPGWAAVSVVEDLLRREPLKGSTFGPGLGRTRGSIERTWGREDTEKFKIGKTQCMLVSIPGICYGRAEPRRWQKGWWEVDGLKNI